MYKVYILFFAFLLVFQSAFGQVPFNATIRPDEPFTQESLFETAQTLGEISWQGVPSVNSARQLMEMFRRIRDVRGWVWNVNPGFPRRLNWVYPGGHCSTRAQLMAQTFQSWGYPLPKQLFVFGSFALATPYGTITWWYHVAPVVSWRGTVYVLDPAINPSAPLPVHEWMQRFGADPASAKVNLCSGYATRPDLSCEQSYFAWPPTDGTTLDGALQDALNDEWTTLKTHLGSSSAVRFLGDFPPWIGTLLETRVVEELLHSN